MGWSNAGIQMKRNKALLNITDPIFTDLAPKGSFLLDCLVASKWDDKNTGSESLAHYNIRLAVSKLLQLTKIHNTEELIKLLTSPSKALTKRDIFQGFKSAELLLIQTLPITRAKAHSVAFRSFIKNYSSVLLDGSHASELRYESILWASSSYQKNSHVGLFEINIKGTQKSTELVDPDLFPNLFTKDSVLHHLMKNVEASSKESPKQYSVIAGLKAQFRDINEWSSNSAIKVLLNTPLHLIKADSINTALLDYERQLYMLYPDKKNHQTSTTFRHYLFTYALTLPEQITERAKFKPNFDSSGKLKFRPSYNIKTTDGHLYIDSFFIPSILPTESLGEICFKCLEKKTKHHPAQESDLKKLLEVMSLVERGDYKHARLLFSKKPQDLIRYNIGNGLKELEEIICRYFPEQEKERITLLKQFLNLCPVPTRSGKLIRELSFGSNFITEEKPRILTIKTYSKTNGKKKIYFYQFNLTKIAPLLSPDGLLVESLNDLKNASDSIQIASSMLSNIELTLGYIVEARKNGAIKHILTKPLRELYQRDFRLGFSELEDIIDAQLINTKAGKSQALRTFLNKHAGKINGQIDIKNCGFSTRFNAADERSSQKIIEPVDENGEILPSPILEKHLSLDELKKRFQDYLTHPIDSILSACKAEIANYKKLLDDLTPYTSIDESGQYTYSMPKEVTSLVMENQLNDSKSVNRKKLSQIREQYSKEVLLGAYTRHQLSSKVSSRTVCSAKSELVPDYVAHWFPITASGMKDMFWSSVFLPKIILLVCFIRLTLRTTWNKDVIATLKRSNLPETLSQGAFSIGGFKQKVSKNTTPVTIEPHEKEIREAISFLIQHHDNMVSYGVEPESLWDTPDSTKLSFLSADTIDNFREHYTLPYFRLELLAKHQINLRKGIDGDLLKSQMERNHGSSRVTAGYLSHPIAQLEYEANNADFQRRLETTVQFRDKKEFLNKYGFNPKNIDEALLIAPHGDCDNEDVPDWFLLPDGSSCTDIFASVDKSKRDSVCRGRACHKGDGCEFNRVEIGIDEFVYTLRHQAYYISRGMALLDKYGREYFNEFIAPAMRFTFGLAKYVEFANPALFKEAKERLVNAQ